MLNLNRDVMTNICKFLDVYDVVHCSGVNKECNEIINSSAIIWQVFEKALRIEPANNSNPKESIKKFFAISLGACEAEIKKGWSETLRKKIRKLPYIQWEKIASSSGSCDYDVNKLFNTVTTPVRTTDGNHSFVLCFPHRNDNNEIDAINVKKFRPTEDPTLRSFRRLMTPTPDMQIRAMQLASYTPASPPKNIIHRFPSNPNWTLSQFIEVNINDS